MRCILMLCVLVLSFQGAFAADPLTIGLTLGLTGKYAALGEMQERGYRLWEQHVNEAGGILDRPVRLLIHNDESDPDTARRLYETMIVEDGVDLVLGPYSSGITAAVAPVVESHRYPMLTGGASADSIWSKGYRYVFGVYSPASRYAVGFLEVTVLNGLTRLAVVAADDSFSLSVAHGVMKWAERFGLEVAMTQFFEKGSAPYPEMSLNLKRADPEMVVVCGHFNESVEMRRAMQDAGWYPKAYFATVGPATQQYHDTLGDMANLSFSSSQYEPRANIQFETFTKFNTAFHETYGMEPAYQAAAAYAAGELLHSAIERAGTLDREAVREALLALDTTTIIGRYGVDRTGMQIKHSPLIVQWQKGIKEIVWPTEVRTADPVFIPVQP